MASFALQDYGNRVCLWRMLEVFDHHKIRCTVSLNEAILEHFPYTKEALLKRDYDFMSHGIYNNRFLNMLSIDEERAFFKDCVDTLYRHTGKQLKGMLTPAVSPSDHTHDLMAEAGLIYNADWGHDDQPFPMKVKSGRLLSMPYNLDLNDGTYNRFGCTPEYWAQCIKDQFDVMYEEGAENGTSGLRFPSPIRNGTPQPHQVPGRGARLHDVPRRRLADNRRRHCPILHGQLLRRDGRPPGKARIQVEPAENSDKLENWRTKMPAERKPGYDMPYYDWSPLPTRPTLKWPNNARVALCVILSMDHYQWKPDQRLYERRHARVSAGMGLQGAGIPRRGQRRRSPHSPTSSASPSASTARGSASSAS